MNLKLVKKKPIAHIFKYSIPSIIAMILTSLISIIDGYFISKNIGQNALAAINLAMPTLYVFLAVAIMIGVGGVSIAGKRIGEKDFEKSNDGFNQTIWTGIVAFIMLALLFEVILKISSSYELIDAGILNTIRSYYGVMFWVYPFMMLNLILGIFIRCESRPNLFMVISIIATLTNIVLDYVFIVYLKLGVAGAAYASGISIMISSSIMLGYFFSSKSMFYFKKFVFKIDDLRQTLANGSSEFIGQLSYSITLFLINAMIMDRIGFDGVAAMTIIGYSRSIYNMISVGFGQGINTIVSVSLGAGMIELGEILRKYTSRIVMGVGFIFYLILSLSSDFYGPIFTQDHNLIELVSFASKIYTISFIFAGFSDIASVYFTAIGYAKQSAIISSLRGLILLSINIFVLPMIFGNTGIWLIAPVTEAITFLVAIYYVKNNALLIERVLQEKLAS